MESRPVVLSDCSGGGKSTLLDALADRGHAVVPEPGRRIVAEQRATGGRSLPWVDPAAFARRAVEVALADLIGVRAGQRSAWTFFDRGLVDAVTALRAAVPGARLPDIPLLRSYHPTVFVVPPWPEIYTTDTDRRHSFDDAVAEHERLVAAYTCLGYTVAELPRLSVDARADVVERALGLRP